MKKSMRVFLTICGIVICVGLILGIAGLALGGIQGLAGVEARVPWISFGGGEVQEQSVKVEDFSSIDLESDFADVEFIEGKSFAVEMSYNKKYDVPKVEVKNGTLVITPGSGNYTWFSFDPFGVDTEPKLRIYYPKGTDFQQIKLQNDMGNVTISNINAEKMEFSTSSGSLNMDNITVDYMKLDMDMGTVQGRRISTGKGADAQIDTGSLDLSGSLAGTIKVGCDMGKCLLTTDLPRETYSIEVENDMGDCAIDGKEVGGTYSEIKNKSNNYFGLDIDTGSAEINFR